MQSQPDAQRSEPSPEHNAGACTDEGNLEDVSVARLLARAWGDQRSGSLVLTRAKVEVRLQITAGAPTAVDTTNNDDNFALTLEDSKTISAANRLKVEKFAKKHDCSQARALLSLGLLDAKIIYQKLREESLREIAALLEWQQGEFVWEPPCPDTTPGKPFDLLKLLQEEIPKRWDVERLFEELSPDTERHCELVPKLRRVAHNLAQSSAMAERIVQGMDGSNSIGRMLGETAGDAVAASTLWVLLHTGLVRTSRYVSDTASPTLEFEVIVDDTAASANEPDVAGSSKPANTSAGHGSADANSAKGKAVRAEITLLFSQIDDISHYDLLGVSDDANVAQIKKAYFKAAKKFHPDALGQLDLCDIADDAAKVFERITEAFETLSDADKRETYDRGDVEATEIDTARLTQAETSFRKGEILLRMGNFVGALEYLEPAVELWPEEPAYQAALGWALFKQPKSNPARAHEHLSMAHDRAPEDALVLFRQGLILREIGEDERSQECIARAKRLDPSVSD